MLISTTHSPSRTTPMSSSSILVVLLSLVLCFSLSIFPITAQKQSSVNALVFPVTKDASTSQYIATIYQRTPLKRVKLTLDVSGKILWVVCDRGQYTSTTYNPARCGSPQCKLAGSKMCSKKCFGGPRPGCNDDTCTDSIGQIGTDLLVLRSTGGSNPGRVVRVPDFLFSCGSSFLLKGLAKGVAGVLGLGDVATSVPSLLSSEIGLSKKFAICLTSGTGVAFLGNPRAYVMQPQKTIRLVYTPLLVNRVGNVGPIEYFISVESVTVNSKPVLLNRDLLRINSEGYGGTKISTTTPYTILHTSIYDAITKAFVNAISKVPRVSPVSPFKICYNAISLGSTRVGPGVPPIELLLKNNVSWYVFGSNSIVFFDNFEVGCLAFLDGGRNAKTSIVIGGYQLENNLLEFDLAKSRLGISNTLLGIQTTCGNFNFTLNA